MSVRHRRNRSSPFKGRVEQMSPDQRPAGMLFLIGPVIVNERRVPACPPVSAFTDDTLDDLASIKCVRASPSDAGSDFSAGVDQFS